MKEVINTGERILLDKETPLMIARHASAYAFAKEYCRDRSILDIGCGEGYGARFLAEVAKEVVGLDRDNDVIEFARHKYPHPRLSFEARDIRSLHSLGKVFERVTCFQVIEHLQDAAHFLSCVQKLLTREGLFICSTCNRRDASPKSVIPSNKFHVREYLHGEFRALLTAFFSSVEIYGVSRSKKQKFYRFLKKSGISRVLPSRLDPVKRFFLAATTDDFVIVRDRLDSALDFIAVCKT
jgi:2-polyprenyl-3-methyl-5-hydroxy-6-metoxy-1,4-benzoquinol methylase